ncbi:MAG: threonine ammonia-lyase, biosynthetic [Gammaproteobacteria bacterium]|nr:threonine ammonia-lyase, biosynthetic [Gammaproteobacteria bacterium]
MRLKIKKTGSFKFSNRYLDLIAKSKVYDVAINTPISFASNLSSKLNNDVFLKREDMQPIFSFKIRGAYNKIANLSLDQQKRGVITASAGNHAQGVANACKKLKIPCLIVMPVTAPEIKIKSVKRFGSKVLLYGDNFDQASKKAFQLAKEKNLEFIEAFDDPLTIAGQGTIGKEILDVDNELDIIFVPVGGGGLIAGISAWVAQSQSKTKIYGVEVEDSACLVEAIKAKKRVRLREVGLFADGVAVERIGKNNFDVIKECVDGVITVSIDELCAAVKDIFEDTRVLSEPAGALALAGLKKYASKISNKRFLAISSGANVNFERLSYIVERSEVGENREKLLSIQIPEKPGSFLKLCKVFGKSQITEFNYRFANEKDAHVLVGIKTKDEAKFKTIKENLAKNKFKFSDLTKNQISNDHLRHMVGGHKSIISDMDTERLFRCQFPVRPGALAGFLNAFGSKWNISLFHYRNLGAAFANVLIGIDDKSKSRGALERHLKSLDYSFVEETDNSAYREFLK